LPEVPEDQTTTEPYSASEEWAKPQA
jgi:hypothetical protein